MSKEKQVETTGDVTLGLDEWDWILSKLPKDVTTDRVRQQAFSELAYWFPNVCEKS